jgi:hypothetical protein
MLFLESKQTGCAPFKAIEAVISWEDFTLCIAEADQLARPESFDHIHLVIEQFNTLRRYTPKFLEVITLRATPGAQAVLDAIEVIRDFDEYLLPQKKSNALKSAKKLPIAVTPDCTRTWKSAYIYLKNSWRQSTAWRTQMNCQKQLSPIRA